MEKYTLPFSKPAKSDHNWNFSYFQNNHIKQQKFSQSDPVLIRQYSKKLKSDPVLIRLKLASVLIQSDPVLIRVHLCSIATKLRRLDACEEWKVVRWCRAQATSHKSQGDLMLMAGSIRRVWALRQQTGEQYSAVEGIRARVAIRRVVAPAPQPEPASRPRSATRDVSFLRNDARCRRYVSDLSNVAPR